MEVHVELGTETKMFDSAPNSSLGEPNTRVTPVSVGLPGSLPVTNQRAVEYAIKIGLALNCEIAPYCRFSRKNYFYPDLAKAYQISQYDEPIAHDGYVDVEPVSYTHLFPATSLADFIQARPAIAGSCALRPSPRMSQESAVSSTRKQTLNAILALI